MLIVVTSREALAGKWNDSPAYAQIALEPLDLSEAANLLELVLGRDPDLDDLKELLLKRADGTGRLAVNEILISSAAVSSIIREGATQKLQDVIVSGKAQGMQFMDDAIWALVHQGRVSPREAFMKAIDKKRFERFLPAEEAGLAHSAGAVADEGQRPARNLGRFGGRMLR